MRSESLADAGRRIRHNGGTVSVKLRFADDEARGQLVHRIAKRPSLPLELIDAHHQLIKPVSDLAVRVRGTLSHIEKMEI